MEAFSAGWEGKYCGTVSSDLRVFVVAGATGTAALLAAASVLMIIKHSYVPIAARGATGLVVSFSGTLLNYSLASPAAAARLLFSHCFLPCVFRRRRLFSGGIIWLLSAVANIEGETFGYNSAEPAKWQLWIPLTAGAGLWIASALVYLRTMVTLHVFHKLVREQSTHSVHSRDHHLIIETMPRFDCPLDRF
jgi:hypothetical protein